MKRSGLLLPLVVILALGGCSNATTNQQEVGTQLSNEGRWEEAITEFDEAIRLNPKDSLAYYNRPNAHRNLGDYHLAIQDYDQVLGLNPRDALAYDSRADAYLSLGEYHLAIQDYDEALSIFPEFSEAYAGRARSYKHLGKDIEAKQDVERAVEFGFDRVLLEAEIEEGRRHGPQMAPKSFLPRIGVGIAGYL